MPNKSRRTGRFEVEWVTVSYRTLARWSSLVLGILVLVGLVVAVRHIRDVGRRRDVERQLLSLERDVRAAREARIGLPLSPAVERAEDEIRQARRDLAGNDVDAARIGSEAARQSLLSLASEGEEKAHLLRVEGEVNVKATGGLDWTSAKVGRSLGPGDLVRTGSDGAAQILNLDGSLVTLEADTILRIERSARDRVSGKTDVAVVVNSGQLAMSTGESLLEGSTSEVRTATASASVERQTVVGVGVDAEGGKSRIDVLEGRARVRTDQGVVDLGASERLSVAAGGAVERARMPGIPQLQSPPQYQLLLVQDLASRPLELEWESARDARSYRVELGRSPLFTQIVRRWENETKTYAVPGTLAVGRYYWRVTAIDREGVEGGPSPAGVFQVSDARPEGVPPTLEVTSSQALGEGMFLFEGRTLPGVFLSIDDGVRVVAVQPARTGQFRHVVNVPREGNQTITITARNSEGLERKVVQKVEVKFQ